MAETTGRDNCEHIPGQSGEIGCLQYLPSTWELFSKEVLGYVAPKTYINEKYVAAHMIEKWLRAGYTPFQIGLKWNGGEAKIKRGVNRHGQPYDTAAYASRVLAYLNH